MKEKESFILTFDITHITFGEWLWERDYVGISYGYNRDDYNPPIIH